MQSTSSNVGRYPFQPYSLRIFADYTTIVSTDLPTINMIKRLVNISTLVFYNMLTVDRLETLYYPANVSPNCKIEANSRQHDYYSRSIYQEWNTEDRPRHHDQ